MTEVASVKSEDNMGVVVGDQLEGNNEDVILIPDEESDEEIKNNKKTVHLPGFPLLLLGIGVLILVITIIVWVTTDIPYYHEAVPVFWLLLGLFLFTHGLIAQNKPPEIYSLEVIINGKQMSHNLPLKTFLLSMTNIVFGITGVVTMNMQHGPWWWGPWNILGLILSILLILWVLISAVSSYSRATNIWIDPKHCDSSRTKLNESMKSCGDFLGNLVDLFNTLLPIPSISSFTKFDQIMKNPRKITNKPVHIISVLLAMIICVVMFSAQLWDVATMDCSTELGCNYSFDDPEDTFARDWDITSHSRVEDRKLVILISTPITFLLCTMMLLLMRGTTVLKMITYILISFGLGVFFFIFSMLSVQYVILMGLNLSRLSQLLTLVSLMPIPLLAAVFMALAYSSILQVEEVKDGESPSRSKTCYISISIILAIVFLFLSLATMTSSNLTIMSSMQGHWNTTRDHGWDEECRNKERNNNDGYYWNHHYYSTITTTTAAPEDKPEKCYGKQLHPNVQDELTFFTFSQLFVTESFLFLCLLVFLIGRRISKKSLFIPGLFLFASAISTFIAFFSAVIHYEPIGFVFLLLNGINTIAALIIGFICIIIGGPFFISATAVFFRIFLSISVFVFIIPLTLLQSVLTLAGFISNIKKPTKTIAGPEVISELE